MPLKKRMRLVSLDYEWDETHFNTNLAWRMRYNRGNAKKSIINHQKITDSIF